MTISKQQSAGLKLPGFAMIKSRLMLCGRLKRSVGRDSGLSTKHLRHSAVIYRVDGIAKNATVDVNVGTISFQFKEVEMPSATPSVPPWFPKAGFAIALLTLVFFMGLVVLSVFGMLPPPAARFLVVMTLSLCAAFAFT